MRRAPGGRFPSYCSCPEREPWSSGRAPSRIDPLCLETRFLGAAFCAVLPWRASAMKDSAAAAAVGFRSQGRIVRPSSAKRVRSIDLWRASRRRFIDESATSTHALTDVGSQSRPRAIPIASRRYRSTWASSAAGSASSVLSSMTRRARQDACQASASIDPRSPKTENVTSWSQVHPRNCSKILARCSCIEAWRSLRTRSLSPPSQDGENGMRTSIARAISRRSTTRNPSSWPRSARDTPDRETRAASATSVWRQLRRIRSARSNRPTARSSTDASIRACPYRRSSGRLSEGRVI